MADEPEVIEQPVVETPTPPETPPVEEKPPPESQPEEADLGGDNPQAVRARKEYQARKRAVEEANGLRLENARLQERARVLEEQAKQPPPKAETKIFSKAELEVAIEAGQITRADAARYEDEILIPYRVNQAIAKQRQADIQKRPVETAQSKLEEYVVEFPGLKDQSDKDWQKIKAEYDFLTSMGYQQDYRTQLVAVRNVKGDLDQIRKNKEVDTLTRNLRPVHAETSAGGNGAFTSTNKVDTTKAPETMQKLWNSTNTTPAQREVEFKHYLANQKRIQGR